MSSGRNESSIYSVPKIKNDKCSKQAIIKMDAPSGIKGPIIGIDKSSISENYGVCFQHYKEESQHVVLRKLKPHDLIQFDKLLNKILASKTEEEFSRYNRGKNKENKKSKLKEYKNLIHLGLDGSLFRLHGILKGKIFKVISIDPKHEEHEV